MDYSESVPVIEKRFETQRFVLLQRLSDEFMRAEVEIVRLFDGVAIRASGRLLAQNSLKHYEVKYPSDWRQAFKEHWFPAWLLKHYPVQYTTVVVDVDAVYPELHKKLHMPDEPNFFQIRHYSTD